MKKIIILMTFIACACVVRCSTQLPMAKATVKAVDDGGSPMEGIAAYIAFQVPWQSKPGKDTVRHQGITDRNGIFYAFRRMHGNIILWG
jgi:hypothetical protein